MSFMEKILSWIKLNVKYIKLKKEYRELEKRANRYEEALKEIKRIAEYGGNWLKVAEKALKD